MSYSTKALTHTDEIWLGLKKRPEEPRTILVAYPRRYSNSAVAWVTKWVNERELESMKARTTVQEIRRQK